AATNSTLSVSNLIGNLTPGTTYHAVLVATNSLGIATGNDIAFTTLPLPPTVATLSATVVSSTNATLHGTVNPNGGAASGYFQYGLKRNYDNESMFVQLPATNAALNLPGLVVNSLRGPAGTNWGQSSLSNSDWCIASSADGSHLVAGAYGGGIHTSTNSGS